MNLAVENSSWSDESQLQEMYMKRKSFAFNSDRPGAGGEMQRDLFETAMKTVDVTFQVCVCWGGRGEGDRPLCGREDRSVALVSKGWSCTTKLPLDTSLTHSVAQVTTFSLWSGL